MTKDTPRAYQALQVFRLGSLILVGIVLVKASFSTDSIGDFEWFLFLSNAVSFFWALGLKNAFMSFFPKLTESKQSLLIFNVAFLFFTLGILVSIVLLGFGFSRMESLFSFYPLICCYITFSVVSSLTEHILLVKQESKKLFYYGLISYGCYFLLIAGLAIQFGSIEYLFYGLVIWSFCRFLYLVSQVRCYGESTFDLKLIGKFFLFGLPLIIHVLLGGGMEYVDGYLVNTFFDRTDFALFRYGARELPINTIFISGLASAMIPLAVASLNSTLDELKKRTERLMTILFPVSMVLMLTSPILFSWIYSNEFVLSAKIFNIYLLVLASRILLPQIVLYAKHKNSILMIISFIELAVNVGLSLLFLQFWGMLGIAFATVIAFMIQKVILVLYSNLALGIPLSKYLNTRKYILYSLALYFVFIISYFYIDFV